MITRDPAAFFAFARKLAPDFGPATARAALLVAPDGFAAALEAFAASIPIDMSPLVTMVPPATFRTTEL